jgi:hypothetical protein
MPTRRPLEDIAYRLAGVDLPGEAGHVGMGKIGR